jgi:uncharacterized membrane protein
MRAKTLFSSSGIVANIATLGAVAAGVALVEAALVPAVLIGGAAMLVPRLFPNGVLNNIGDKLRDWTAQPTVSEVKPLSSDAASFDAWRAVVKTITYRVALTSVDFGANYFVIGELATAAGLSGLSLVAGPIAYFAHEAAWHYYGPPSTRNSLEAAVDVPIPGVADTRIVGINMSRALGKTITYEGVTAVSEFSVNYFVVRDLAAAAGLAAFSVVISPFVYYFHEKVWDYYDAKKASYRTIPLTKQISSV